MILSYISCSRKGFYRDVKVNKLFVIICRDGDLPLIVAIDLQPMAPIEGVIQVQGDITNARTAEVVFVSFPSSFVCITFLSLSKECLMT